VKDDVRSRARLADPRARKLHEHEHDCLNVRAVSNARGRSAEQAAAQPNTACATNDVSGERVARGEHRA
jgi:hypothetical protein